MRCAASPTPAVRGRRSHFRPPRGRANSQGMSLSVWSFPTRILFGNGAVRELGKVANGFGSKALIVTDPGVIKAGVVDAVRAALDSAGVAHATFDGVHGNPYESDVDAGVEAFRKSGAKLVIAV